MCFLDGCSKRRFVADGPCESATMSCGSPSPPASSIATQHLRASWWNSAAARPVRGLHCPDVRGRMLRNLLAWIGLRARKSGSAKPFASRKIRARFSGTIRKNSSRNRVCGRENEKPPDGYPRAFACLGDRGDRSPEEDQSWCMPLSRCTHGMPQSFDSARASASRWKRDVSNELAVWKAGFMGGLGWNSW